MSDNSDTQRLLSKRRFLKGSMAFGGASLVSGTAAAGNNHDDPELEKVDENDTFILFRLQDSGGTKYLKSNKETGKTRFVESTELANEHGIATADVSIATVPESAGIEIIKRSEAYERTIETCAGDCGYHALVGSSHELEKHLAGATKSVIGAAIVGAAIAIAPAGAVAALGTGTAKGIITTALSGALMAEIEGNNFSIATVDTDIKYVIGVTETAYPGTALGPWKPGGSALLMVPSVPLTEHQYGCS